MRPIPTRDLLIWIGCVMIVGACSEGFEAPTASRGETTTSLVASALASGNGPSLSAGEDHTCGLSDGAAYCWGQNSFGKLGDGTTTDRSLPTMVAGNLTFAFLRAGTSHTCGLTTGGAAYCWGWNNYGEVGDGSTTDRWTPVSVAGNHTFTGLKVGPAHTCGLTAAGAAYCWGYNGAGQLGDGTTTNSPTPVSVIGNHVFATLVSDGAHTCGLTSSGTAYCWGYNAFGQIGDGTTSNALAPVAVQGNLTFTNMSAGMGFTCGVTSSGAAYCWGFNWQGQLGDGTKTERHTPVAVAGGVVFASLSTWQNHACGLTPSGAAYCWGSNLIGQLGDGTEIEHITPAPAAAGLTFSNLTLGIYHTCGSATSGVAYCWGWNLYGQLGDGTGTPSPTPVQVVGFPPNGAPSADAGGPYAGSEGGAVSFNGSASSDPDNDPLTYDWDFGDGSPHGSSVNPAHAYADNGIYTVTLTVSDGVLTNASSTSATISNVTPTATLTLQTPAPIHAGQTFVLRGGFSDAGVADGAWGFALFRNTTLLQQGTKTNQPPPGATQPISLKLNTPGTYTFKLQLTDKDGATGTVLLPVQIVP